MRYQPILLLAMTLSWIGCTPDEEKITKLFQGGVEECKKSTKEFAEVELFNKSKELVLRSACDEPLGKVTIVDGLSASAPMGPYQWLSGIDKESGIWVIKGIVWDELSQAKRLAELNDPEPEDLERAEKELAAAQEQLPTSSWIRLTRLKNHLNRQAVRRRKEADPEPSLGQEPQAYFEATLAWAKERSDADSAAQARYLVIDYLKRYKRTTEDGLDNLGSGDEALERVIAQAKLEKDKDTEQKYTETLEKERAERPERQAKLEKRRDALQALICKEVAGLNPAELKDEALRERITAIKTSTTCS